MFRQIFGLPILFILISSSFAQVPEIISFQGRLADASGVPVADGDYILTFRIYDSATGGSSVWSEIQTVHTANGLFSVMLGSVTAFGGDVDFSIPLYVSLQISSESELEPRFALSASPYAFNAIAADTANFASNAAVAQSVNWDDISDMPADFADGVDDIGDAVLSLDSLTDVEASSPENGQILKWNASDSVWEPGNPGDNDWAFSSTTQMFAADTTDNVGIGTSTPTAKLEIQGTNNDTVRILDPTVFGPIGIYISNTATVGLYINKPNDDGLVIDNPNGMGIDIEQPDSGEDGIYINCLFANNDDGIEIYSAGDNGVEINYVDSNGVEINDAGKNGVEINDAGNDAILINHPVRNGMHILKPDSGNGIRIDTTSDGYDGIIVFEAGHYGIDIEQSSYDGVYIRNPGNDGVRVEYPRDGVNVFQPGRYGVYIHNPTNYGVYIDQALADGINIDHTEGDGIEINTAAENGVYIHSSSGDGITIEDAGIHGIDIDEPSQDGVNIFDTGDDGIDIMKTGGHGIVIDSTGSYGIHIDNTFMDGIRIDSPMGEFVHGIAIYSQSGYGIYVDSTTYDGIRINHAGDNGIYIMNSHHNGASIINSDSAGILIDDAGTDGIQIDNTDDDGIVINNAGSNGLSISNSAEAGILIDNTPWLVAGIELDRIGGNGIEIHSPGVNGITIDSAFAYGILITDRLGSTGNTGIGIYRTSDGIEIHDVSLDGLDIKSPGLNGIEITNAGGLGISIDTTTGDGIWIGDAGEDGIHISSAALLGVHIWGTGSDGIYMVDIGDVGLHINNCTGNGIQVDYPGGTYAGYFGGTIYANYANAGIKSFLIDHPSDPTHKLLRHYSVESPEVLLIYRGKASLDETGEAEVKMPDYFIDLVDENGATVQLTPIGRPFMTGYDWDSHTATATLYGEPLREVAYVIYAERDDPVKRMLAEPVEEDKSNSKYCPDGKLLIPEAYGYPKEMGIYYEEKNNDSGKQ